MLAINGKQAGFLAGGEYPYPVVQGVTGGGTGAVTIQFKEYGVRLNFIPTVTPRNTIRLQVAPEVSALDFTNGVSISGFTVPGITVRRVKTDVELSQGQSFAIGGLLDNRETQTFSKIPFIGDVPILGKFFQSIDRTKANTELIVIVTPEIVAPIPAGAPLPDIHYPAPFLPPNSDHAMANPGPSVTGAKPLSDAPPTMPVEKLIESMKPEQPLIIDSGMDEQWLHRGRGLARDCLGLQALRPLAVAAAESPPLSPPCGGAHARVFCVPVFFYGYLFLVPAASFETRPRPRNDRCEPPARGPQPERAKHSGVLCGRRRSRTGPHARPTGQAGAGRR